MAKKYIIPTYSWVGSRPLLGTITYPISAGTGMRNDDFPNFPFGWICFLVPWRKSPKNPRVKTRENRPER